MIVNQDLLRKETVALLSQVNRMIDEVKQEAEQRGTSPEKMRDMNGTFVMTALLQVKAQAISALVELNKKADK